tara:strand:+ start:942 stop:1190 length:249 start_codon:yes stop_codon:yes gene_type:complete
MDYSNDHLFSLHPEFFRVRAYGGLKDGPLAPWVPVRRRLKFVDTSPTVAEIRAKYAQINLMRYISQYTKKNPSVFFGSIKQF